MTVDELLRVVDNERLDPPVLYDARQRPDAVVLERDHHTWTVYVTSERAWPVESTIRSFDGESSALEHVLLKLRQLEKARRSLQTRPQRGDAEGTGQCTTT